MHQCGLGPQAGACGLGRWVAQYLDRLRELESHRPAAGGDRRRFDEVRAYREAVARLSLATLVGIALKTECLDDAIRSTYCESDVAVLFRLAMHCQIIDDVVDYEADLSAGLPSFLTACASRPQALASTAAAARSYGARRRSAGGGPFPLEAALYVLAAATALVVAVAGSGEAHNRLSAGRRRA